MPAKKTELRCVVCSPAEARPGDYCDLHRDELHRLDHEYETLFRLERISRGKDHETYLLYLQGECDPCGRVIVSETDPENLAVLVLVPGDLDLDARITEYDALKIERTYGDKLRERLEHEIVHSWYGSARACVDIFRTTTDAPTHWDIAPRPERSDEEESHAPEGGSHSVH